MSSTDAGADYTVASGLVIPAGQTSIRFDVNIRNDDVVEGMESFELLFTLSLGNNIPQSLRERIQICGRNDVIVKITDDDGKHLKFRNN